MNDAVLIQHAYANSYIYYDMLRLAFQRHSAYANAHKMDYWAINGDWQPTPDLYRGAYAKIGLIQLALDQGYRHVFWIDPDAAIINMECDLRDALPNGALIGAAKHDPAKSPYLASMQVPAHYNVGVLYVRNGSQAFMTDWIAHYHLKQPRFMEQEFFNEMIALPLYAGIFAKVDDTWNATVNVNMVERPNVKGWHGVKPDAQRLAMMRAELRDDYLKFRV